MDGKIERTPEDHERFHSDMARIEKKTQPQELLEEVIGITHGDTPEFPTLEEQQEYWRQKDSEEAAKEEPAPLKHLCRASGYNCDRAFKSAQALRMHIMRVHTKTILTKEQKAKLKRVAALPQNPTGLHEVTDKTRKLPKFPDMGRPVETQFTRRKWSLARRRAYNRKKRAEILAQGPARTGWEPVPPPPREEPVAMIKFCPHCGSHLEKWLS